MDSSAAAATNEQVTSLLSTLTSMVQWGYTNITNLVNQAILPNPFLWVPLLAFFIIGGIIGLTMRIMGR